MRIAWTHSFPPHIVSSGIFMHQLADEVQKKGIDIKMVYIGSGNDVVSLLKNVKNINREVAGCDLIHAQYGSGCGYFSSKLKGPKILTVRGSDWYGMTNGSVKYRLRGVAAHHLTRLSLKKYDHIYVMSSRMKTTIEHKMGNALKSIEVLPDGINLKKFKPMNKLKARKQIGFEHDTTPWVLFSTLSSDNPLKRTQLG